jgi:glycosyltransferase involved in cell wall biosynthesis
MGSGTTSDRLPSATVVIPCFNYGRFVRDAVRSALEQTGADTLVVLVNDGSTDARTARQCDACRGPRVQVIHQANAGLPAARNRGACEARTEYLVFLDADDWIEPTFVATLHRAIAAEDAAGRGGDVSHAYCQERLVGLGEGLWRVPDWDPMLLMITTLHPVTALVRRDRFEEAGGFDESMRDGYEDWDLWLRLASRGWRGVRVREPLFTWRRHSTQTMISSAGSKHSALYRQLVENHRDLYQRHAAELCVRMNCFLRRHDLNWLDQTGLPRELRYLQGVRDRYESMGTVRLHHAIHGVVRALPGPLAAGARRTLVAIKRLGGS